MFISSRREYWALGGAFGLVTRSLQLALERRPPFRNLVIHLAYAGAFAYVFNGVYNFDQRNQTLLYDRIEAIRARQNAERAYAAKQAEAAASQEEEE